MEPIPAVIDKPIGAAGGVRCTRCSTTADAWLILPAVSLANARTYTEPSEKLAVEISRVTVTEFLGGLATNVSARLHLSLSADVSIHISRTATLSVAVT